MIITAMPQTLRGASVEDGVSGDGDEPWSVLNVPRRLARLSVRMIPGLISPPDWIWSPRERERERESERDALNPALCALSLPLSYVREYLQ